MEKRLTQIINMVRNFLFSSANREFLTFFFFLVLSTIFWLMTALNETYEREIGVPAYLVNIPKNVVVTSDMEDTVRVTVRDKGFALLAYTYGEGIRPINVNFQSAITRQSGYGVVSSQELMKMINQRFIEDSAGKTRSSRLPLQLWTVASGVGKDVWTRSARQVVLPRSHTLLARESHSLRQQAGTRLATLCEDCAHQHHQLQRHRPTDSSVGDDKGCEDSAQHRANRVLSRYPHRGEYRGANHGYQYA